MNSNLITAVGIDVSKGKSTIAIRRPGGEIVRKPFAVKHDGTSAEKHGSSWSTQACIGGLLLRCCSRKVSLSA